MSTNCLVTKYKRVVNNDNLPEYGAIKVHINTADVDMTNESYRSCGIKLVNGGKCHIKVKGTGTFNVYNSSMSAYTHENVSECTINYGDTGHENGWLTIIPNAGEYDLIIGCKYNAQSFSIASGDSSGCAYDFSNVPLSEFNYMKITAALQIGSKNLKGILKPNPESTIVTLKVNTVAANETVHGATVDYSNLDLSTIQVFRLKGLLDQQGSVTDFGSCVSITNIGVVSTGFTGDIADLAAAQVAAGRTSGNIKVEASYSNVTIDGEPFYDVVRSHDSWNAWIVFDSSYAGGYDIVYTQPA